MNKDSSSRPDGGNGALQRDIPEANTPSPDQARLPQGKHASLQDCTDVVVVLGNAPDMLLAKRIAHILVEEHYAACVNLGAASVSMYLWDGKLEGAEEVALLMKTSAARAPGLVARYMALHPYDVPEVLVLPVAAGSPAYLDWVREQTGANHPPGRHDDA